MKRICVFCGSNDGARPKYVDVARRLGVALARRQIGLVFGGGRVGLMGTIANAVLAEGGEVIGVIPHGLRVREVAHDGVSELRVVDSMHERKALMASLSDAFVSRLERGQISSSVANLIQIAQALDIGVSELFADPPDRLRSDITVHRHGDGEDQDIPSTGYRWRLFAGGALAVKQIDGAIKLKQEAAKRLEFAGDFVAEWKGSSGHAPVLVLEETTWRKVIADELRPLRGRTISCELRVQPRT